ncbi:unnamed protein product [Brassica oleracea]
MCALFIVVKVLMGRTQEGRAYRRIKVQMCPQMLVPRKVKLQNRDARYLEKRDVALALCRAKSDRTRKLAASQQSSYTANNTAKVIIPNKKLYPGYNPFAPIDKKKLKELAGWLKLENFHYRTPLDNKPRTSRTWWYQILRTSLEWLEDCHIDAWINVLRKRYDANLQYFRSERICFLDHLFAQNRDSTTRILRTRSPIRTTPWWDVELLSRYYTIILPIEQVVWDNICSKFSKKDFAKANGKTMRDKMAVDIFQELPDAHEFENKDNDANLGAYEG